jgi:hypothetical protein
LREGGNVVKWNWIMLDARFWKKYFDVYDVLNLLIPYQELLETIFDELEIKPGEKILEEKLREKE